MIKYNVRSRQLIDILGEVKRKRIIISPFFQRNLVWRTIHKVDFIKTILKGYPFPEIFIANGDLDIEEMTTTSAVVDGQQRLNSILEYVNGEYSVDELYYSDLDPVAKENFLKYEIAIIELDIKYDDPEIKEIFKRLNRTFYSLSNIEKLSTEYAPSEFMLVGKLIAGELFKVDENEGIKKQIFDPNVPKDFIKWTDEINVENINKLIVETPIFSPYEISRQVHLMFSLNILGTILNGFTNRNVNKELIEEYSEEFPGKEDIVNKLNLVARKILKLNFPKNSYWFNKANSFTLITAFYNNYDKISSINEKILKASLKNFEQSVPNEYQLAAKEGVNNKKERLTRNKYLEELIEELI